MDEDPSKYRTLTFGGRTISYDFENIREENNPQGKTAKSKQIELKLIINIVDPQNFRYV